MYKALFLSFESEEEATNVLRTVNLIASKNIGLSKDKKAWLVNVIVETNERCLDSYVISVNTPISNWLGY